MNENNYWDTFLVIEYLENNYPEPNKELREALEISGLDSGESCVFWMIKNDRMNLNQFWMGEPSKIHLAVIRCKKRNETRK